MLVAVRLILIMWLANSDELIIWLVTTEEYWQKVDGWKVELDGVGLTMEVTCGISGRSGDGMNSGAFDENNGPMLDLDFCSSAVM